MSRGQTGALTEAPIRDVSPGNHSTVTSILELTRIAGTGLRGKQQFVLPDSTSSLTILTGGYSLTDFRLSRDSLSWDPEVLASTDSTVNLEGLIHSVDSLNFYADTLTLSVSGVSPFQKSLSVDGGRFIYFYNYPFVDRALFPEIANHPIRHSLSIVYDSLSTIGAPGFVDVIGDDSTGLMLTIQPANNVTTVGSYLVSGPFNELEDRVILEDGSNVGIRYLSKGMETRTLLQAFGSAPDAIRFFNTSLGLVPADRTVSLVSLEGVPDSEMYALAGLYDAPGQSDLLMTEASRVARTASSVAFNFFGRYGFVTPADSWLYTGLPTYLGAMFLEADQGPAAFDSLMLSYEDAYFASLSSGQRPLFFSQWNDATDLIDDTAFLRGAWTMHMVRKLVGEQDFKRVLSELQTSAIVQSDNLTQILEVYLPDDLEPFQRELFYGASHIKLEIDWQYSALNSSVDIEVSHADTSVEWPSIPITVEVETLTGVQRHYIVLDEPSKSLSVSVSGRPRYVTVDPDQALLAEIAVKQPVAAWVAQLRNAESLSVRVKAARALEQFNTDPALLIGLKSALRDETRIPVKVAILKTVSIIPAGTAPRTTLMDALTDQSAEVRVAALEGLAAYGEDPTVHARVVNMLGSESDERVLAQAVRYLSSSTYEGRSQVIESALITPTRKHLVRIAGIQGVMQNGDAREQREVGRRFSSASYPATVRTAAIQLQAHALSEDRLAGFAKTYLNDGEPELRMAAASLLPLSDDETVTVLAEALNDEENPLVRKHLRTLLFRIRDK